MDGDARSRKLGGAQTRRRSARLLGACLAAASAACSTIFNIAPETFGDAGGSTGRASADNECVQEAQAAGLNAGPWTLPNGTLVFGTKAMIPAAGPEVLISKHADGTDVSGELSVWTDTMNDGTSRGGPFRSLPASWTSPGLGVQAGFGDSSMKGSWSFAGDSVGNIFRRIYCFQL